MASVLYTTVTREWMVVVQIQTKVYTLCQKSFCGQILYVVKQSIIISGSVEGEGSSYMDVLLYPHIIYIFLGNNLLKFEIQ